MPDGPFNKDSPAIRKAIDSHVQGHELADFNVISAYLKHFYVIEKVLENTPFGKNPGTQRTIKEAKYFETPTKYRVDNKLSNYFIVTKVFVIVDHLLSALHDVQGDGHCTQNLIRTKLAGLKDKMQDGDKPYEYDMGLVDSFMQVSHTR